MDTLTCDECGTVIAPGSEAKHKEWHASLRHDLSRLRGGLDFVHSSVAQLDVWIQRITARLHKDR